MTTLRVALQTVQTAYVYGLGGAIEHNTCLNREQKIQGENKILPLNLHSSSTNCAPGKPAQTRTYGRYLTISSPCVLQANHKALTQGYVALFVPCDCHFQILLDTAESNCHISYKQYIYHLVFGPILSVMCCSAHFF